MFSLISSFCIEKKSAIKACSGIILCMLLFFNTKGQKIGNYFTPSLVQHIELKNISYEDYSLVNIQNDQERLIYFFYNSLNSNISCITIDKDWQLDSLSFKTELFEEPFDIQIYQNQILVLEGSKLLLFNRDGSFERAIDLKRKYEEIIIQGNELLLANSYNYLNTDSTFYISSLKIEEELIEDVLILADWDGMEFSHFFHDWICINSNGLFIAKANQLGFSYYNWKYKWVSDFSFKGEYIRADPDSLKEIYNNLPPEQLKKTILELQEYSANIDYIERIFHIKDTVFVSLKTRGASDLYRLVLGFYEKDGNFKHYSTDSLFLEMFSPEWSASNAGLYDYSNFPFHLHLARDFQYFENYLFTALEMSYFPKQKMDSTAYLEGMEEYFEKNSINYSILIYEL